MLYFSFFALILKYKYRPKNQNKCWNKIGSPPAKTSKKLVLKLRSVSNIVIPPANTGKESNNIQAVTNTDHTNNGKRCHDNPGALMFIVVLIKLIAPKILLIPAKCKLKITKSTLAPE